MNEQHKCRLCKETKVLSEGFLEKRGVLKDGTVKKVFQCRACSSARARKYYQTDKGRERVKAAIKASIQRYPEKQEARRKLLYYIKRGYMKRPDTCSKCGSTERKIQAHHTDYTMPLSSVVWLCTLCHHKHHKSLP